MSLLPRPLGGPSRPAWGTWRRGATPSWTRTWKADLTGAIDLALAMLVDLPRCRNRLEPRHRPRFLAALYPTGLTYDDGTTRTVENSWRMATSEVVAFENEGLAPPTGLEPAT